jgi:UDPglucose 6-dehydrogenase
MKRHAAAVMGMGYVGATTAACLASRGVETVGLEESAARVAALERGRVSFSERGLADKVRRGIRDGLLSFASDPRKPLETSEFIFVTVGTPARSDGRVDLAQVVRATKAIGKSLGTGGRGKLVVLKSTVPPGTTEGVVRDLLKGPPSGGARRFDLVFNPEFLREGSAVKDMLKPSRIVIGSEDPRAGGRLREFYRGLYGKRTPPIVLTNTVNAELIKYANNAFLAAKVSFINEVANLCTTLPEADVDVVAHALELDSRIGSGYMEAGLGYGGSCIPKDVKGFAAFAREAGAPLKLVEVADEVNEVQPEWAIAAARRLIGSLRGSRVAVLGLAFKPGTDDTRDSTSVSLIRRLLRKGSVVSVYDPAAAVGAAAKLGRKVKFARSVRECLAGSDLCIIATAWDEFASLSPSDFAVMRKQAIVDSRRVLKREKFDKLQKYAAVGLGRGAPAG